MTTQQLQQLFGAKPDGGFGPASVAAAKAWVDHLSSVLTQVALRFPGSGELIKPVFAPPVEVHHVKASSFADPADIAAFRRCKALGKSDSECFKFGDNGIGRWSDDTTVNVPMCALPYEDWENLPDARGKKVLVKANGKSVVCELRDTMPRRKNIKNGAGIDLNEAAWKALGKKPPVMMDATWQWL